MKMGIVEMKTFEPDPGVAAKAAFDALPMNLARATDRMGEFSSFLDAGHLKFLPNLTAEGLMTTAHAQRVFDREGDEIKLMRKIDEALKQARNEPTNDTPPIRVTEEVSIAPPAPITLISTTKPTTPTTPDTPAKRNGERTPPPPPPPTGQEKKTSPEAPGADTDKKTGTNEPPKPPKPPRFAFETVSDLRLMPAAEHLIEGWIPERSVGLLYGRWGSGKTFTGFDWALHLAYGFKDWHGAKLPGEPCDVLIIAREGHSGFIKRVDAFKKHHGLTEDPGERLIFMRKPISFLDDAGFAKLKEEVTALQRPFRFVLVDTVGRVLPGADMAKEQPITLFMERLQQIGEITGGTSLGVHHENKSGDANGSMYFQNTSDFMFQASREGDGPLTRGKITCMKQKDGDDLWSRELTFIKIELADGKSSLAVESVSESEATRSKREKKPRALRAEHKLALEALDAAMIEYGKRTPVADAPADAVTVHKSDWMEELFRRGVLDKDDKNRWRDFARIWKALAARHLIAQRDDMFWRVTEEKQA